MAPNQFFALSFLAHLVLLSSAEEKKQNVTTCPTSFCEHKLGNIGFPYKNVSRSECGLYTVDCSKPVPKIQFKEGGHWFGIERISQLNSILINETSSSSHLDPRNCKSIESFKLPDRTPFSQLKFTNSWTLFNCSRSLGISVPRDFNRTSCGGYDIYYTTLFYSNFPWAQRCSTIQLPPVSDLRPNNEILFSTNFTVQVYVSGDCFSCYYYGKGQCETNSKNELYCFSSAPKDHKVAEDKDLALKLGLGIGIPLVICVIGFLHWCYKRKYSASCFLSRKYNNVDQEGGSVYFGVYVFAYKDLEQATNNFDSKNELGDGGFGTVYHGKLKDGREVAVKRFYNHNYKREEQYMNEIEILTRLRHENLVSLYGCTSRRSEELLLVYEYIPNGTVAEHLHGERAQTSPLTWAVRMSIAIETATALTYLHASDIVHRDVKTNNILLDKNFCVKVADFGLSRLFPNDASHVSTAPQGTPGYVDPEYHQCYQLTSKSDVYSFGVVLVELISSMPAVDMTRHRHEINLSNLALSKIQKGAYNELVDLRLGFHSNSEVKRMIIALAELAFQCLQQDREMRPSMDVVLAELKRIESGDNESENQVKDFDGATESAEPPSSPDWDEVGLLKSIKEQSQSPNTVTGNWQSSRSSTPNISC